MPSPFDPNRNVSRDPYRRVPMRTVGQSHRETARVRAVIYRTVPRLNRIYRYGRLFSRRQLES